MVYVFLGFIGLIVAVAILGGLALAFLPSATIGKLEKRIQERSIDAGSKDEGSKE